MPATAQALSPIKSAKNLRKSASATLAACLNARREAWRSAALDDEHGFRALLSSLPKPANDDALDALLDTLDDAIPADDEPAGARPAMPLDWLDAGPDDEPAAVAPVPGLVTMPAEPDAPQAPMPGPSRVTGLVTKRPRRLCRRSHSRQREDARKMRASAKAAEREVVEQLPPLPDTPTEANKHALSHTDQNTPTDTLTPANTNTPARRGLAPWDDAGELPRIISVNRGLDRFGVPHAFSLNLDPKLIRAANDNPRGFTDYIRRRLALTLKRALGRTLPFWFAVETDDDGRPHLHGGFPLADNDRPDVIERAFAKAGGNWTRQGSAPAHVRRQHDPDGWASYACKRLGRTRRVLREAAGLTPGARVTLWTCTDDLRAEGQSRHAEARKMISGWSSVTAD